MGIQDLEDRYFGQFKTDLSFHCKFQFSGLQFRWSWEGLDFWTVGCVDGCSGPRGLIFLVK